MWSHIGHVFGEKTNYLLELCAWFSIPILSNRRYACYWHFLHMLSWRVIWHQATFPGASERLRKMQVHIALKETTSLKAIFNWIYVNVLYKWWTTYVIVLGWEGSKQQSLAFHVARRRPSYHPSWVKSRIVDRWRSVQVPSWSGTSWST